MHAFAVLQQPPLCGKGAKESWQRKSGEELGQPEPSPKFLSAVSVSSHNSVQGKCSATALVWKKRVVWGSSERPFWGTARESSMKWEDRETGGKGRVFGKRMEGQGAMQKEGLKEKKVCGGLNESCGSGCKFVFAGWDFALNYCHWCVSASPFPNPKDMQWWASVKRQYGHW